MEALRSVLFFLLILVVLVVVHEWGHFIVAKLCKMRVEDFSIFFGKRLIRLGERGGTEYNIRSIPLGGFVKITGMEPDDLSAGSPIFRLQSQGKGEKILRGLRPEMLAEVNFDNVSERIVGVVDSAVQEGQLTSNGQQELQVLLNSASINADEHRYLEAILSAANYLPDPAAYNQKPLWQRAAVIFAGPFISFLFGYFIFCVMGFTTGLPYDLRTENVVQTIIRGKPADRAGIRPGDRIVRINETTITTGEAMIEQIRASINKPLSLTVLRDGQYLNFTVTPEAGTVKMREGDKVVDKTVGMIGFGPRNQWLWKRYSPVESVKRGTESVYLQVTMTLKTLTSFKEVKENASGIIGIGRQIHEDSKEGARNLLLTSALLSVSLGIFNLLPIPVLDGGHLLLLAWEGLRRRKLSSREVYSAQMLGLCIILVLFVLVMYNDITRIFLK
jgi:regulator of sigma E protease